MNEASHNNTARVPEGDWGGVHVRMKVLGSGALIEYDCAHGTLDASLALDSEGHFEARGTHVREGHGPIRLNALPVAQAARYRGRITGATMTLTVTLDDSGAEVGVFKLTHGSPGRVWKCR